MNFWDLPDSICPALNQHKNHNELLRSFTQYLLGKSGPTALLASPHPSKASGALKVSRFSMSGFFIYQKAAVQCRHGLNPSSRSRHLVASTCGTMRYSRECTKLLLRNIQRRMPTEK